MHINLPPGKYLRNSEMLEIRAGKSSQCYLEQETQTEDALQKQDMGFQACKRPLR